MELKKDLKFIHVFSIAAGAMISSGLFILPGIAHADAGPAVIFSYLIAGFFALIGTFSLAEIVTAMPKSGGDYFYINRIFGPAVGTIAGILSWFSLSLKSAFALIGMAAFTKLVIELNVHYIAVALCIFFIVLNLLGVKKAGRFQVYLVLGLLLILGGYIVTGLPKIKMEFLTPFVSKGYIAIFSTAGTLFVSYGGLLQVASVAEEVDKPGKTIPKALISALIVVTIIYALAVFVTSGVLEPGELNNSLTPISDGGEVILGTAGMIILSVAAILAFVTTANAGMLSASRYPMALSRDKLFPKIFGKITDKSKVPYISIIVTGGSIAAFLFLELEVLVKAASTVILLSYLLSCASVIIIRESKLQNYRPTFKAPFYPLFQILGIIGYIFLLFEMGTEAWLITIGLIVAGIIMYIVYGRINSSRESALLHLIERVTAKELVTRDLEDELKDIIRERDEIKKDQCDLLFEKADVIDLGEREIGMEKFFEEASEFLSKKLEIDKEEIYEKLLERERDTSTVLIPFLAVPHIIVEEEGVFEVLFARSKKGIYFTDEHQDVKALFVIIGSKEKRHLHLKVLASIVQIVREQGFMDKWLSAKNKHDLRDIVLLSDRFRPC